ncbi:tRNA glutamyl-Q(34) synthetase GluQRS [Thermomonas flagellata]|uniref:tRNA glutamyl-Q(34) synthetase GluQRS n=1 Tax=Thermomonas flagellata TaxID=2888524 RepID=UPI001F04E052|nr:tRNA glutamyl-Q(34) synthetase GluQRS [Thermomonas flagellata]
MNGAGYRGRFAPSPTGPLHAGSLLAALGSWLRARRAGGQWRVRIEDLDPPREVPGAAQVQLATLAAFGLHPDGAVIRQSRRSARYQAALERLLDAGLAFECHCSRADLAATGGIHRACVARARRPDPAIRLRVADGCTVAFEDAVHGRIEQRVDLAVGDFVLRRADGLWAYQLAVVVDDAAQGITEVVRGADLLDSTPRQILLQRALGLPTPRYLHLPLLVGADGRKLSKSEGALAVDPARPLPLLRALWAALGQAPLPAVRLEAWLAAAPAAFRAEAIPRGPVPASAALHNTDATGAP